MYFISFFINARKEGFSIFKFTPALRDRERRPLVKRLRVFSLSLALIMLGVCMAFYAFMGNALISRFRWHSIFDDSFLYAIVNYFYIVTAHAGAAGCIYAGFMLLLGTLVNTD
jgi:hypothetical protein